jgi:fluoride exporter
VTYLWVALGAAIGGVFRYWCYGAAARLGAELFPWGTLFVNVSGSAVLGFFATLSGPDGRLLVGADTRVFVMAGLCGGFTTYSTFSLETLRLMQDRQWLHASLNIAGTLALCLAGVWLGHLLAVRLNER